MPYGLYDDQTTKQLVIEGMLAGLPWDEARQRANAPVSRATVFRWHARFATDGAAVFHDQRHGHTWLLTQPIQTWIVTYCQTHPHTPSHALKAMLATELDCIISVSRLNVVRGQLGVTYQRPRHEKKDPGFPPS